MRTATRRPCARSSRATRSDAEAQPRLSRLLVFGTPAGDQVDRMRQRRLDQLEAVAAAARRSREIHDQGAPAHACETATEQPVRCLAESVCAESLGDPRNVPIDDRLGRLRREITRRDARAAGRQDHARIRGQCPQRRCDLRPLIGNDAMLDLVLLALEQLHEESTAFVVALPGRNAVRDREDGGLHTGSFVFSTSVTSVTAMPLSIAFAMSYTVNAATETAVSASISTPVCAVVSTTARISTPSASTMRTSPPSVTWLNSPMPSSILTASRCCDAIEGGEQRVGPAVQIVLAHM